MKQRAEILAKFGITIGKEDEILDFGCGAGRTVYTLLDQGYSNVYGYEIDDYLKLRKPEDRSRFFIADSSGARTLPFDDNSFDFIVSESVLEHVMDQVGLLRELYRVMRPGGCAIHIFPARYSLRESHNYVPLGGFFAHRWWYKWWAMLGIRNEFQKDLSADEVADRNAFRFVENLNYVPNSCYEAVWRTLGYEFRWLDQEYWDTSHRAVGRVLGKINRALPFMGWLNRTFRHRTVLLIKPKLAKVS
jgi:SAM-dependent methyltransferase